VLRFLAEDLGLCEPVVPWHTSRAPVAETGTALGLAAGAVAKVALDVALLAQTEVAEASEPAAPGRGGSSTLPHKRNPVGAAAVSACARRVHALVGVLLGSMAQEHERAVGAWQAEWEPLREALALTGGAVSRTKEVIEGLELDPGRMRENLGLTGGLVAAEQVMMVLAPRMGRLEAHRVVEEASTRARGGRLSFREELLADPEVGAHLSALDIDAALDPDRWLGSSEAFIDRALAVHRRSP
jgi:3-carboxy-cis,cis-muconate cycloisomerase